MTIVALGGGTGLPAVLRALRRHLPASHRITAIVTAADDGGSSGVLRRQYGVLPPGDIRNCLLALARVPPEVSAIRLAADLLGCATTSCRPRPNGFTWSPTSSTVAPSAANRRSRAAARRSSGFGSIQPTRRPRPACWRRWPTPTRSCS